MGKGLHPSGYNNIIIGSVIIILIAIGLILFPFHLLIKVLILITAIILIIWIALFFRKPKKTVNNAADNEIYSPAFGKVVVLEKIYEDRYFNEERIQLSIFMSLSNIHLNFMPCNGKLLNKEYQKGHNYHARKAKASMLNEMSTLLIESNTGKQILMRQIAGATARRVVTFIDKNESANAGDTIGVIRFGSRVDLILPVDTELYIKVGDKVKGGWTLIGRFK